MPDKALMSGHILQLYTPPKTFPPPNTTAF